MDVPYRPIKHPPSIRKIPDELWESRTEFSISCTQTAISSPGIFGNGAGFVLL